ncbi:Cell wall mannoprotein 1 [Tolypocladium paradoxum]|uniref:Cell wall mannoprotein 1 n=1 Tax=Tolypocladium paradoxum TaxID=94208 RepID=A0A2S4KTM2_9HYPO|nr:Cell wall mannoprotein 1 [Tolypocladium paradoxum]
MKFSAVTLACLATGVYSRVADPPVRVLERDLATVTGVIGTAGQDIDAVAKAINAFSGDSKPVEAAAAQLISNLGAGKAKVDGSSQLTLADALGLQQPVKDLEAKGQTLADDLHKAKPIIEKAGLCDVTRKQVNDINTASQALISAVVSKVPTDAQAIAKALADGLIQILNKAQDDFSTANCKNSGGGGSSSASASASASATGSQTSAPGTTATGTTATGTQTYAPGTTATGTKTSATGIVGPTGSATTHSQPTGTGVPTKPITSTPPVTAGAALVAPAGALAMAVAALML